jgi:hypothetical protein
MNYIPVPATAEGIIDLPDHAGVRVRLASPPSGSFTPDGMTLNAGSVTASLISSLGFGGLVLSGSTSVQYYLLDFAATQHIASPDPSDGSQFTVAGVGLRVAFRGISVSGKASYSLGALAASATLNSTATAFEAQTLGIGLNPASIPVVQSLISSALSSFNVGTMQTLGQAFSQLGDYLATNSASLTPGTVGVVLDSGAQIQSVATSYGYALRCIEGGNSLLSAQNKGVKTLPAGVQRLDPVLIATYASVLGSTDPTIQPSSSQKGYASQLDKCGP